MLDRLALGLVSLPDSVYSTILILSDPDGGRLESQKFIRRETLNLLVRSLKNGGRLYSQDGSFAVEADGGERREAVLAGLIFDNGGLLKPDYGTAQVVQLRRKKDSSAVSNGSLGTSGAEGNGLSSVPLALNGKRKSAEMESNKIPGVGFVDFSDDLGDPIAEDDDDELIDENTLLDEADLARPIVQPPECRPKAGKRRRACKDCTCGLKEKIEAEDAEKRATADKALDGLKSVKLEEDDLAEIDFTVQGKVGSCGSCGLGDAFRCAGCPYIGLPAFKPGEEVRLLNNDVQL
jgi:hypothetical protein